jgi:competence protein ComEC
LRGAILAFALGAAWLQTRAALPATAWTAGLPLLALGWWLTPRHGRARHARAALAWMLALACGFQYAAWRAELRMAERLPEHWAGRDVAFVGRVVGLPETTPRGLRFVVDIAATHTPGARLPGRVQLGWYVRAGEPPPNVRGGDCIDLVARLHPPRGSLNPGGFDYAAWLLERGIRATGSVRAPPRPAAACGGTARAALDRLRERVRAHLRARLGDAAQGGVVVALAIGDQDAIAPAQWTLFRQTGTTHLFSVSGLHITLFSAMVFAAVRRLWRSWPALNLRLPARRAGIALGMLAALAYTAISGFGIPAQRTLLMLLTAAGVAWLDRAPDASRLLAAALLVVVLFDPWAALAPGFWLSFGAVAALLYAGTGRLRPPALGLGWLRAQWAVTVALMPALLALFHEISLVSPLANLIAIPAISLVAVPLSLLAAVSPWAEVAWLAHAVVAAVVGFMRVLVALPQPLFHAASPDGVAIVLALLGTAALLLPRGMPGRWLGALLFLPLLLPRAPAPAPGQAWLTALDVGQGAAVVVRTHERTLLVDAGNRYASGEDAGARVVAPYLWSRGVKRLDGLVITHDDLDHSGGALSLLASHRPAWLLTSIAGLPEHRRDHSGRQLLAHRADAIACAAGQHWRWDGVEFTVLHPPVHHYAIAGFGDNDRSCVIEVRAGRHRALLTGDIQRLGEMNLLERDALNVVDVVVVPHHGSKSSSTPAFVAATRPAWAVIQVGWRNPFGHPHPEVLARYRAAGATILRTDRDGAVTLVLGGDDIAVSRARDTQRRYWHSP